MVRSRGVRRLSHPLSSRVLAVGQQLGVGAFTLFTISIVTFGMMSVRSADQIAHEKFGPHITQAQVEAFAHEYGLDRPLYWRYGEWLFRFVQGDMGTSYVTNSSVAENVIPRLQKTLVLSTVSLIIALPISIVIGVFQARRVGTWTDLSLLIGSVVLAALPEFVVGIGLLFLFAVTLGWLPVDSATALTFSSSFADQAKAYVLPAATLVLAMVPYIVRIARGSVHEALVAPYTQAAILRGLPPRMVIWDHAMRNASVPLVNAVAVNLVYLLSGVIVVESVFAFPGLGAGLVQATSTSDGFTVQAIALVMGVMFIIVSLLADIVVIYLNPRLKGSTR